MHIIVRYGFTYLGKVFILIFVVRKEESGPKFDTSKAEKSSKIDCEDDKSKEATKENNRREKKRSRHSRREGSRRHKDEHKKSRTEGERLQPCKNDISHNVVLKDVVVKPKTGSVVHNDLFSSDSDDDTPMYDVYSLARLFQGQVTENFRTLNSHILDPAVETEEPDNELYCLCRYSSKT